FSKLSCRNHAMLLRDAFIVAEEIASRLLCKRLFNEISPRFVRLMEPRKSPRCRGTGPATSASDRSGSQETGLSSVWLTLGAAMSSLDMLERSTSGGHT